MCTIMEELRAEGRAEARAELVETFKALKSGVTITELLEKGIDPETVKLAEELL